MRAIGVCELGQHTYNIIRDGRGVGFATDGRSWLPGFEHRSAKRAGGRKGVGGHTGESVGLGLLATASVEGIRGGFGLGISGSDFVPAAVIDTLGDTVLGVGAGNVTRDVLYSTIITPFITIQWPGKVQRNGYRPATAGALK